jgi:hypothetical protein
MSCPGSGTEQAQRRGLKTGSALILQAAFADINIHKSRSVYYWLAQLTDSDERIRLRACYWRDRELRVCQGRGFSLPEREDREQEQVARAVRLCAPNRCRYRRRYRHHHDRVQTLEESTHKGKAEHLLTFIARIADIRPVVQKKIHPVVVTPHKFQSGCHKLGVFYDVDLEIISSAGNFAFEYKGIRFVGIQPQAGASHIQGYAPTVVVSS